MKKEGDFDAEKLKGEGPPREDLELTGKGGSSIQIRERKLKIHEKGRLQKGKHSAGGAAGNERGIGFVKASHHYVSWKR